MNIFFQIPIICIKPNIEKKTVIEITTIKHEIANTKNKKNALDILLMWAIFHRKKTQKTSFWDKK